MVCCKVYCDVVGFFPQLVCMKVCELLNSYVLNFEEKISVKNYLTSFMAFLAFAEGLIILK